MGRRASLALAGLGAAWALLGLLVGPAAAQTAVAGTATAVVPSDSVRAFGAAGTLGGEAGVGSLTPIVGITATPNGGGYWLAAAGGGVFAFGDARFYGSLGGHTPLTPIVGITATPDGGGYWLAAAGGGVFAFGDARFYGSLGGHTPLTPIVGITATPDGGGYWLAAAGGGVFAFGDARFYGSLGGHVLPTPIVGITATANGGGYWLAAAGGGVFAFGDARFYGSLGGHVLASPIVGITAIPNGGGYWSVNAGGDIFSFGDAAPVQGGTASLPGGAPAVGISARSGGGGWVVYGLGGPAPLAPAIAGYLDNRAGSVTAAVYDASTGQSFVYAPGLAQDTASIVKVDIMSTLLHQVAGSPGALSATQQALLTSMIEVSDNNAATALWNEVGGAQGVSAFDALEGLTGTTPGCCGYWGLTTTTANDQVNLVRHLAFVNGVLDNAQRGYALSLMENVVPYEAWGISGGVPAGVTVALKNGWLPLGASDWQVNSIGWVDGQGRNYVIAVLSTASPTEGYGIATIQAISAQVWAGLDPAHLAPWAA